MKLETIIKNLKELKEEYNPVVLDNLINKLEQDYKENLVIKKPSDKARLSAIKKVIDNTSSMLAIHGYSLLDNKIVFTDSYQLYVVNDEWLPFPVTCSQDNENLVKELAKKHNLEVIPGVYPNVKNIIPSEESTKVKFKVNLKEVLSACKTQEKDISGLKPYDLKVNEETVVTIDLLKLETLIKIMRISDDFELEYHGEYRPLIYRNNGEIGLVLPIRIY